MQLKAPHVSGVHNRDICDDYGRFNFLGFTLGQLVGHGVCYRAGQGVSAIIGFGHFFET